LIGSIEPVFGNGQDSLVDVLDIDGDGVAEVILQRSHCETSDIEVLKLRDGQLVPVMKLQGWTGS